MVSGAELSSGSGFVGFVLSVTKLISASLKEGGSVAVSVSVGMVNSGLPPPWLAEIGPISAGVSKAGSGEMGTSDKGRSEQSSSSSARGSSAGRISNGTPKSILVTKGMAPRSSLSLGELVSISWMTGA